jgi:hypothetical protein
MSYPLQWLTLLRYLFDALPEVRRSMLVAWLRPLLSNKRMAFSEPMFVLITIAMMRSYFALF